jgi:hypothetical protein
VTAAAPALVPRFAGEADLPLLVELNQRLIRDEGHANRMTTDELCTRMAGWLASDYRAVLFELDGVVVAYALTLRARRA